MRRFSIRDLLWLTLVVGLAVGWYIDNKRLRAENESFAMRQRILERMGFFEPEGDEP